MTPSIESQENSPVFRKEQDLLNKGGQEVASYFRVATERQGEVVFEEHRYLVTPHDAEFDQYTDVLSKAHLLIPQVTEKDEEVAVVEIPRDSRSLPQFAFSFQPEEGFNAQAAVKLVGHAVRQLMAQAGVVPNAADFTFDRTMIVRSLPDVLFVPPLSFVPANEENKAELLTKISEELNAKYKNFGATALYHAFEQGVQGE